VAQGSVISPALFNIFIEDLADELQKGADINLQDILMYADDILTLCTSYKQLRDAIKIIESWSKRNGMELNKLKSGIVPFANRNARNIPYMENHKTVEIKKRKYKSKVGRPAQVVINHYKWKASTKDILGIPICEEYKYLGTILTPKLSCEPQIKHINRKAAHIHLKLSPYLSAISAEGRKDMFTTLVLPLFNSAYMLLTQEPSQSCRDRLERTKKVLFKQFMGLSKVPAPFWWKICCQ